MVGPEGAKRTGNSRAIRCMVRAYRQLWNTRSLQHRLLRHEAGLRLKVCGTHIVVLAEDILPYQHASIGVNMLNKDSMPGQIDYELVFMAVRELHWRIDQSTRFHLSMRRRPSTGQKAHICRETSCVLISTRGLVNWTVPSCLSLARARVEGIVSISIHFKLVTR